MSLNPVESDVFLTPYRSARKPNWGGRVMVTTDFGERELNCGQHGAIFETASAAVEYISRNFTSWADNVWLKGYDGDWKFVGNVGELANGNLVS